MFEKKNVQMRWSWQTDAVLGEWLGRNWRKEKVRERRSEAEKGKEMVHCACKLPPAPPAFTSPYLNTKPRKRWIYFFAEKVTTPMTISTKMSSKLWLSLTTLSLSEYELSITKPLITISKSVHDWVIWEKNRTLATRIQNLSGENSSPPTSRNKQVPANQTEQRPGLSACLLVWSHTHMVPWLNPLSHHYLRHHTHQQLENPRTVPPRATM